MAEAEPTEDQAENVVTVAVELQKRFGARAIDVAETQRTFAANGSLEIWSLIVTRLRALQATGDDGNA